MIADLIRLTCLVPLRLGNQDSNGRYFLHVYDDDPQYYLPYQNRPWVKALHQAGRQDIVINQLSEESHTAKGQFGEGLENVQIQAPVGYSQKGHHFGSSVGTTSPLSILVAPNALHPCAEGVWGDKNGVMRMSPVVPS